MTRSAALKSIIRARAAKTGERYTTARRHVLASLPTRVAPNARASEPPAPVQARATAAPAAKTRGGLSEATSLRVTGHGLEHWFTVLDRFGGVEKGHTASARHLAEDHKIDGWYAQGITVAFERARGVRGDNQRCDGKYEVSVSKVLEATTENVMTVSPERLQAVGVKFELARRRPLDRAIRTVGQVEIDERRLAHVNIKLEGWIDELLVISTGERV